MVDRAYQGKSSPVQEPNQAGDRDCGREAEPGRSARDPAFGSQAGRLEARGSVVMRYMVVIERGETSWGAHVPDLPGCVAVADTREEVVHLIGEAIELHIETLRQEGLPLPK